MQQNSERTDSIQKAVQDDCGLLRLAVISPELRVADVTFNTARILEAVGAAAGKGCHILLFPELCITGYSCGDLFYEHALLEHAQRALFAIARATADHACLVVVGLPLRVGGRLYNCAALLGSGLPVGIVPKVHLPGTREFYEERWFSSENERLEDSVHLQGHNIPFGADLLFRADTRPDVVLGLEICEDLWSVEPPSGSLAIAGATVLLNPSASPEILGKADYRRKLVSMQSARCFAAYAYASSGPGESSSDVVFSGHSIIGEYGAILAESARFAFDTQMAVADVDIQKLLTERMLSNTFGAELPGRDFRTVEFHLPVQESPAALLPEPLYRVIDPQPFVPRSGPERDSHCEEIFAIQTTALARRLRHTALHTVLIGLSGGLDSTLALLVCLRAFDKLGLDRTGIRAVTMPGFGTTQRTQNNAEILARESGISFATIPIVDAVRQHFGDIGHPETQHDVTYENAQARERTQILMDLANKYGGIVIGTGDLSELALGWCTYNADQMSMYNVNAGIPKTLVRSLVEWCAETQFGGALSASLRDICATPVSPELLPPTENGGAQSPQSTEGTIGPYLLHDFFLYNVLRMHYRPRKVYAFACRAFREEFTPPEILRWLRVFYRRFFSQQFKRQAMPDGPKVGTVALSPRGDWRMPSDAAATLWLAELDELDSAGGGEGGRG